MKLNNKVAIITGGSKGIGLGIATVFSRQGAKVVVAARGAEAGEQAAEDLRSKGGEAVFIACDVSNENQVKAMVQTTIDVYGRLDVLVNNAGVGIYKSVLNTTVDEWDLCLNVDLKGAFLCSKFAIPYMQAIEKGAIINISSVHSRATVNDAAPYAAAKGGVTALTRNMAIDYGPVIRVNTISPGWVMTPLIEKLFNNYEDPVAQRRLVEKRQVMKRIGTPEDIGLAAAFLASDNASFITGTEFFVDGGLTAQLESW